MAVKDGGSAFPQIETELMYDRPSDEPNLPNIFSVGGMTLRDYFAGQALIATGHTLALEPNLRGRNQDVAVTCYRMADAMLAEREKGRTP